MQINELTDEKLVKKIREENIDFYGLIIERYQQKLSHYLRKFTNDPDEREDILQIVFIKVYRNLHSFNIKKKFSSWIYRVAHNQGIDFLKKHAHQEISLESVEYKVIDENIDLSRDFDKSILEEKIRTAFNEIKLKYREPLVLFFFEEKSYEEISDILRIPQNTVGTLISRGKKEIKNILEQKLIR